MTLRLISIAVLIFWTALSNVQAQSGDKRDSSNNFGGTHLEDGSISSTRSSKRESAGSTTDIVVDGHHLQSLRELLASRYFASNIFPILHEERRWAIDEEHRLKSRIDELRSLTHEVSRPLQVIASDEYSERMRKLSSAIDDNEKRQLAGPTESEQVEAKLTLISLTRELGALGAAWEESQKFDADQRAQNKLQADLDGAKKDLTFVGDYLLSLDDAINGMLLTTDARNDFKKWICIAFSILVGVVIIGFFAIAIREKGIRDALFANDSGLQFVTLFSLIIAIILFGVIDVSEGRELAALLGGLSGYILGRGTLGWSGSRQAVGDARIATVPLAGRQSPVEG
jgi:hypothetical protein